MTDPGSDAECACAESAAGADISLQTLLFAFDRELVALGGLAERVQVAIGKMLHNPSDEPLMCMDIQGIDLLTQRLFNLSSFVSTVAPTLPEGWRLNPHGAAKTIVLEDLAERLRGRSQSVPMHDAGDIDLF